MTQPPPYSRRQVAAANTFVRAAMLDNGELCDKLGTASGRIFLCRYIKGHAGLHYWQLAGATPYEPGEMP